MLTTTTAIQAEEAYPRPELLVEPANLTKSLDAKAFIILDARDRKKYDLAHIPGARWVDHAAWAKAFGDGKDAAVWSQYIGALGLNTTSKVIVYDDNLAKDAARIWWILRYWGVQDVRLLNGGWIGWTTGKYMTATDSPVIAVSTFKAIGSADRLATKDDILKSLTGEKWQIVDARSEKEFCGIDALTNKRSGAIPGAKQLEWTDLLDKETHRFKPPMELARLFEAAGVKLDRPTATHCQSGGRAAVMAYGMELMGAKDVRNYYRSFGEWGNADDTPIVKPMLKMK